MRGAELPPARAPAGAPRFAGAASAGISRPGLTWLPGDGSDTVEGQSGSDALDFNGSNAPEAFDISANGSRVRLFRDVAAITMDLDAVEALSLRTLGSSDAVTIGDLTGTGLKRTAVDLGANGGGGDGSTDTVVANGTGRRDNVDVSRVGDQVVTTGLPSRLTISGSEGLNDTLRLNTLGGDDKVTVDPDAELLLTPVIDLGADE